MPRFVMLGGFLGAGKTTTIAQLANRYRRDGKHVVIVTNDQADHLVDTELLRNEGFDVGEVAGSCFCCNFDGLIEQMDQLSERQRPDIILAEPVGSCTDLIATIAVPMMNLLGERFDLSPYAVLLKPSHGAKILGSKSGRGFSPNAEYIFRKQLEEADIVVLNRIDELSADAIDSLESAINEQFPDKPVLKLSAKTGENLDGLIEQLAQPAPEHHAFMDVDYDVYADGEAELGWLNASCSIDADKPFEIDTVLVMILESMKQSLATLGAETAHLKAIAQSGEDSAVANLVSSDTPVTLSMPSHVTTNSARLVVNARVAISPDDLQAIVESTLQQVTNDTSIPIKIESIQSFRPGRPVPTHRVTS